MKNNTVKLIAYYLPQFHTIPENDKWWGEGFTEWTNVKNAHPLFEGHEQPVEPGELGYYDLNNPEVRQKQAQLAERYGLYGFCYWHYWFGNGSTLLDMPFNEILRTGKPDYPFCLGWANESWTGIWHGAPDRMLIEQKYPGKEDVLRHFEYILPAFEDPRYIKIANKPFFLIYKPDNHPDLKRFTDVFHNLSIKYGFDGIHFVATNVSESWPLNEYGFSAIAPSYHNGIIWQKPRSWIKRTKKIFQSKNREIVNDIRHLYSYREARDYFLPFSKNKEFIYPTVVPNWDNSPRVGKRAVILHNSTPELYREHLEETVKYVQNNDTDNKIILLKSWNEWAEGNYIEPDKKWNRAYLEVTKSVLDEFA